jgi:hypothetical protein
MLAFCFSSGVSAIDGRSRSALTRFGLLLVLLIAVPRLLPASVTFERRWHWFLETQGHDVEQTADRGYVVSGETWIEGARYGLVLVRTDSLGDTLWTRQIQDTDEGSGVMSRLNDGGFVVAGTRNSLRVFAQKYDDRGDSVWTYSSSNEGRVSSIIATADGGCLIVGRIPESASSFGVIKVSSNGQGVWTRTYPEPRIFQTWARSATQTRDGGYILCGDGNDYSGVYVRLVRINSSGESLWTRLYTGPVGPALRAVRETPDGGFISVGHEFDTLNARNMLYVLRTGPNGEVLWARSLAPGTAATNATALCATPDGGYAIAGGIDWGDSARVWLLRTDANVDTLWTRALGGPERELATSIKPTADHGFVLAGTSDADGRSILLFKADSLGSTSGGAGLTDGRVCHPGSAHMTVTPNPLHDEARVAYALPRAGLVRLGLYDVTGKLISPLVAGWQPAGNHDAPVRLARPGSGHSALASGVYVLRLESPDTRMTTKLTIR